MLILSNTEKQIFFERTEKGENKKSSGKTDTANINPDKKKKSSQDDMFDNEFYEIFSIVWKY